MSILEWRNEQLFQSITVTCLRQFIESIYLVFTFHRCFGSQKKNYSNGIMALPKFCGYTLNRQKKFCPPGQEITPVCVETAASSFSAPTTFSFFFEGFICSSCGKFINNCLKAGVCLQTSFIGNKGILKVVF